MIIFDYDSETFCLLQTLLVFLQYFLVPLQAKTPANTEFRSKYYRGPSLTSTSVSVPNSPHFEDVEEDETTAQTSTATSTPIVALSESDNNDQVRWRAEALHRRSLAR